MKETRNLFVTDRIELVPLYAQGFFHVCLRGGVGEYIIFRYHDKSGYYHRLLWDIPELLEEERQLLKNNMQSLLDEEEVYFNEKRTRPVVLDVNIEAPRENEAVLSFLITFRAILRKGVNTYLNIYEETVADYDYSVTWVFPQGARVRKAELGVPVRISDDRILSFYVRKGLKVGGKESIEFEL